jgi:uracil-DNA glycosylase family 4
MKAPAAECAKCPGLTKRFVAPESAAGPVRLAVVGEGPGLTDLNDRRMFSGAAGRLLERTLLHTCGLSRKDTHMTHAVLCDVEEDERALARKCCLPRLHKELAAAGVGTVLAVGATALQSASGFGRRPAILKFRGSVLSPSDPLRNDGGAYNVVPTITPLTVVRAPLWFPIFEADVARAGRIANSGFVPPENQPGARIVVPRTVEELDALLHSLDKVVSIDIETVETDGTNKGQPNIHTNVITCLVVADTQTAVVMPWSKTSSGHGRYFNGRHHEAVAALNRALKHRTAVSHNGPAYDHIGLRRAGVELVKWDDSLLAYHAITSLFPKRLGHVVACYIDAPPWKEWAHDVSLAELWSYNGRDGLYTARAWQALKSTMDESDWRVYESDKRSAVLCRTMSENGIFFDVPRAAECREHLVAREAELASTCRRLTGMGELNVLSPLQLQEAFFKRLGAHVCFRSESGAPTLNKEALRAYAAGHDPKLSEFALTVLEYRRVRKCRTTYIEGIRPHADSRVRPTWLSYGTISGRWSSRGPNLANLPSTRADPLMEFGGIRSLYRATPGNVLVSFDIKQAEFRVAAFMSGDPNMMAVCNDPSGDIHTANAAMLFGEGFTNAAPDKQKELRGLAKRAVFAVCYLAEAATVHASLMSEGVQITLQGVQAMLANMQRRFRVYYQHQAELLDLTIKRGYVESPVLGRKRWLGHDPSPPENANFPIQSGAADIMNMKLDKIERLRAERNLRAKLCVMVYDAAYWDTDPADADAMAALCTEVFAEPATMVSSGRELVLPLDVHIAERWSDL